MPASTPTNFEQPEIHLVLEGTDDGEQDETTNFVKACTIAVLVSVGTLVYVNWKEIQQTISSVKISMKTQKNPTAKEVVLQQRQALCMEKQELLLRLQKEPQLVHAEAFQYEVDRLNKSINLFNSSPDISEEDRIKPIELPGTVTASSSAKPLT